MGSPRLATRDIGGTIWKALSTAAILYSNKILDGEDTSDVKRYGDMLGSVPAYVKVDDGARAAEEALTRKQLDWLKRKGLQ